MKAQEELVWGREQPDMKTGQEAAAGHTTMSLVALTAGTRHADPGLPVPEAAETSGLPSVTEVDA